MAAELRAERARKQISVQVLSETADIPYPSLRRYLAAERHIDVAVLAALCGALGIGVAELVETAAAALERAQPADELAARRGDVSAVEPSLGAVAQEGDPEPEGSEFD